MSIVQQEKGLNANVRNLNLVLRLCLKIQDTIDIPDSLPGR